MFIIVYTPCIVITRTNEVRLVHSSASPYSLSIVIDFKFGRSWVISTRVEYDILISPMDLYLNTEQSHWPAALSGLKTLLCVVVSIRMFSIVIKKGTNCI